MHNSVQQCTSKLFIVTEIERKSTRLQKAYMPGVGVSLKRKTGLTTERVIDFSIFDLGGLPLGQGSPKGEMTYYQPRSTILQNFSQSLKRYEICVAKVFLTFWLRGLTPGPKFTKRGGDLVDSEIYHPAKFHRSTPTHAGNIR